MAHNTVPAAEELLDQYLPVLDHGFVRLVDYLGGDARIVQAARVSYGEGTRTVREDKALIHYLYRNGHTSPFEQVENSASRTFQGTGLGLSLTKRLVELHGGTVWAESNGKSKGSTFRFQIPLRSLSDNP